MSSYKPVAKKQARLNLNGSTTGNDINREARQPAKVAVQPTITKLPTSTAVVSSYKASLPPAKATGPVMGAFKENPTSGTLTSPVAYGDTTRVSDPYAQQNAQEELAAKASKAWEAFNAEQALPAPAAGVAPGVTEQYNAQLAALTASKADREAQLQEESLRNTRAMQAASAQGGLSAGGAASAANARLVNQQNLSASRGLGVELSGQKQAVMASYADKLNAAYENQKAQQNAAHENKLNRLATLHGQMSAQEFQAAQTALGQQNATVQANLERQFQTERDRVLDTYAKENMAASLAVPGGDTPASDKYYDQEFTLVKSGSASPYTADYTLSNAGGVTHAVAPDGERFNITAPTKVIKDRMADVSDAYGSLSKNQKAEAVVFIHKFRAERGTLPEVNQILAHLKATGKI